MNPPRPPKIEPTDTIVAITSPTTRMPRLRGSGIAGSAGVSGSTSHPTM